MELFDIALYTAAILLVLIVRANPTPAAEAPQPIEAMPEPQPIAQPAKPATIAPPVATLTIPTEAPKAPADLATLKTAELRKLCSQRGITWRNALGANRHLPKTAMLQALA
jgi:hypothetical protein